MELAKTKFRKIQKFPEISHPWKFKRHQRLPEDSLKMFLRTFLTIDIWDSSDINKDAPYHES